MAMSEILPDVPKEIALMAIKEVIDDGYVELTYNTMSDNPVIELTAKGVIFKQKGGYKHHKRKTAIKNAQNYICKHVANLWEIIVTAIATYFATKLFK